jgi:hypothetical protein
MTNPDPDDANDHFARTASELLRRSAEDLDGVTASRLNRARQAALEQLPNRRRALHWLVPALSTAAVGVLAISLWLNPGLDRDPPVLSSSAALTPADMDLLLADDSLEMLEDLDFYAWLDADRSDEELGAELESAS